MPTPQPSYTQCRDSLLSLRRGRFHAVQMYAGANSGSNSNRFYSFSRGLSHFVVLTAEAYLYARTPAFLANQLAWLQADLAAVDRRATP